MREEGFTLIELMVAMALAAVLLTLSAFALRAFWLAQAIEGATDEVVTELRELQSDATSQSHPLVFGANFEEGDSQWKLLRYDPDPEVGEDPCGAEIVHFDSGAFNAAVRIADVTITLPNDPLASEYTTCVAEGEIANGDPVVWFYARGTSNGGEIELEQPNSGRTETVTIGEATGRVTRT